MKIAIKKLKALYIYEILLKADAPMSRNEIAAKLKNVYGIYESDKTLTSFLHEMVDADVITATDKKRKSILKTNNGYEEVDTTAYTNYVLKDRPLEDKELLWLIDNTIFSKQLSEKESEKIVSKLLCIGTKELSERVKLFDKKQYMSSSDESVSANADLLSTAIKKLQDVSFTLMEYGTDLRLHSTLERVSVKPVRLVSVNGFYYVIAYEAESKSLQHYRLDLMRDLLVANSEIQYDVLNNKLSMEEYLSTHSLMKSGKVEFIKIRLPEDKIGAVIDRFGKNLGCTYDGETDIIVTLKSNPADLYVWALENGEFVEVIEPQHIRNKLRKTVQAMAEKYTYTDMDYYFDALNHAQIRGYFHCPQFPLNTRHEWLEVNELRRLDLWKNHIVDLEFIKMFPNLSELTIFDESITTIAPLECFSRLKTLALEDTLIENISTLVGVNIKNLRLIGNNNIKDYSPIYEMKGLESLIIDKQAASNIDLELFKYSNPTMRVYDKGKHKMIIKK